MAQRFLAILTLAALLAIPAAATPPGHVAYSGRIYSPNLDLKDGAGIADPSDDSNPCTRLLHGRNLSLGVGDWRAGLRIATNAFAPSVGLSDLAPPLTPTGGWLPNASGIPLGIPCPLPGSPSTGLWLVWSGMNWHAGESTYAELGLCTRLVYVALAGNGCFPIPGTFRLIVSACTTWSDATLTHDYTDPDFHEDEELALWENLRMLSDAIDCPVRHSHDYSADLEIDSPADVSLTEPHIRNADVVHPGSGTTYMVLCWRVDLMLVTDPFNPQRTVAQAHDWHLVVDVADPLGAASTAHAVASHLGPGGTGPGGPATALKGIHNSNTTSAGENGYGPCPDAAPSVGKPIPLA